MAVKTKKEAKEIQGWDEEVALKEKDKSESLALFPDNVLSEQFQLSPTVQGYYTMIYHHFDSLGLDCRRHALTMVMLAKCYAVEQICEECVLGNEGFFYSTESGGVTMHREHPASKKLHATRIQIATILKSLGLMSDFKGGKTASVNEGFGFGNLRDL